MKKIIALILVLMMLVLPVMSCDSGSPNETEADTSAPETDTPIIDAPSLRPEDEELYVGYGRSCLTPYDENGKLIEGYTLAGVAEPRKALSVKSDLFASCTAVKDKDGNIALLYSLDLHSITVPISKKLQRAVEDATGVPEELVLLNCTHTHAAIHASQFIDYIADRLVEAANDAIADLSLVTELYSGTLTLEKMNFIRRYKTDENGKAIAHLWDNDPTMPVIRFVREGGKKDVVLANWAAHCDTFRGSFPTAISADYVASFREAAEETLDAHFSMHLGATGDVNPSSKIEGEDAYLGTVRYGKTLALYLSEGIDSLERQTIKSSVKADFEKVKVSIDHSEDETRGEDAVEIMSLFSASDSKITAEVRNLISEKGFASIYDAMFCKSRYKAGVYERINVGAISIGNAVFAVAPYEMFSVNGLRVKQSAEEFDIAFMCTCTNGKLSYIPSAEAFDYPELYEVLSRYYVKGTAELLQDAMIASIDELGK